jgi:hypothetical protein
MAHLIVIVLLIFVAMICYHILKSIGWRGFWAACGSGLISAILASVLWPNRRDD